MCYVFGILQNFLLLIFYFEVFIYKKPLKINEIQYSNDLELEV